ncbi:outer membrane protein assembly factor BamB family protein [Natronolimnohabitans innermongolicus]|uniref:PQQ repeat protein n=1 Tax=Natronolimnohabitans innermongolicus JCM 12255 TaxID=1227499 RepID=L9WUN9_9EURY|nr:PQQ-binding-like beta-propeller repeat protein [Natronolimnohabitans innermongolicus]ELY52033.1 PQQ repeat protein [Natronolimnohabitans innermongolicus JCM 12255]
MNRRRYLAASASAVALAGCLGDGESDGNENGNGNETENGESTSETDEGDESSGDWLFPGHDLGSSRYASYETNHGSELVTDWKYERGWAPTHTALVVADGTAYRAGNRLAAIDSDGEVLWEESYDVDSPLALVDGELLFFNENDRLFRLDSETGERLETTDIGITNPDRTVLTPESIYVLDSQLGRNDTILTAYETATGEQRWQYPDEYSQTVSLVRRTDETIVVAADDALVAIDDAAGDVVWRVDTHEWLPDDEDRNSHGLNSMVIRDTTAYVSVSQYNRDSSEYQQSVCAVDLEDGTSIWRRDVESGSVEAVDDERVYVVDDDLLTAFDATSGDERWDAIGRAWIESVTVTQDVVYCYDRDDQLIAFGTDEGEELLFESRRTRTPMSVTDDLVVANETVYVNGDDLVALQPSTETDP